MVKISLDIRPCYWKSIGFRRCPRSFALVSEIGMFDIVGMCFVPIIEDGIGNWMGYLVFGGEDFKGFCGQVYVLLEVPGKFVS